MMTESGIVIDRKIKQLFNSKYVTYFLLALLVLWRIPFLNKGIDYTDTGFSLTNYYNVFYGNGINDIGLFFTALVGGIIYRILPAYQLLVYRIMHWLLYVIVDIIVYRQFKKYVNKNLLLITLLSLSLFSKSGEALFSYYPFTKIFLILAVSLLISGLTDNKPKRIIISGILSGLNIFVRLPNMLFCFMFVGIVAYGIWTKCDKKSIIHRVHLYFYGIIAGVLFSLIVLCLVMGPTRVIESFLEYVNLALGRTEPSVVNFLGIEETSGHSIFATIRTVCVQCYRGLIDFFICVFPMLIIVLAIRVLQKKCNVSSVFIGILYTVSIVVGLVLVGERLSHSITYIRVMLMFLLSFIAFIICKSGKQEHRLIYLLSFILGICALFGSDLGLNRVGMLQGIVPVVIVMAAFDIKDQYVLLPIEKKPKSLVRGVWRKTLIPLTSILIISMLYIGIRVCLPRSYMDASVHELKYTVNDEIKPLKGMKTSQIRADEIDEYYRVMSDSGLQNYEVAVFGYFPLGYVIGSQRDYFSEVQPCIDYPAVSVESLLSVISNKQEEKSFPIIVLSHVNRIQRGDTHDTSEAKIAVMNYMLSLTEYSCIVDDEYFTIYVPKEKD